MLTVVMDWHTVGLKLGLPHHKLEEIGINFNAYGVARQKQEMISMWLKYDEECSWCKLARVLEEMELRVVAKKIRDKYTPGYDSKFARDICKYM